MHIKISDVKKGETFRWYNDDCSYETYICVRPATIKEPIIDNDGHFVDGFYVRAKRIYASGSIGDREERFHPTHDVEVSEFRDLVELIKEAER